MYFSYPQITWWLNGNSILFIYVFILHKKDHLRFNFFFKYEHEQKAWTYSALNIQRTLPRTVVSPICCVKNRKISTHEILLVVQLASQQGWCSYEMCVVRCRRGVFGCNTWLTEMGYIANLSFKYDIWNFFSDADTGIKQASDGVLVYTFPLIFP